MLQIKNRLKHCSVALAVRKLLSGPSMNPVVFLDIAADAELIGRIVIEVRNRSVTNSVTIISVTVYDVSSSVNLHSLINVLAYTSHKLHYLFVYRFIYIYTSVCQSDISVCLYPDLSIIYLAIVYRCLLY